MSPFYNKLATVFTENGRHKVMLPNGMVIPHLVKTVVTDGVEKAEVTFTVFCNIEATKEEALMAYELALNTESNEP